ncbi:MAG: hypothetical protein DSM107014_09370 [Gomphosphaeria aponina SAG 52.96 = DSM 107014]|uniref:Uncharacterized protein n=1 Tax=Gomphosphaeria aponina SAG 52.96 = DSM 107014 TaxID=1521640 RepID=A0A941GRZ8_9CHRO|nr:hypothetical protein [Gomphosphaeria aponina SAG 52.96 = DSM 107014]
MSFNTYKSITQVLLEFPFVYQEANFIEVKKWEIDPYFLSRLEMIMTEGVVFNSEAAICENIIAPILTEI